MNRDTEETARDIPCPECNKTVAYHVERVDRGEQSLRLTCPMCESVFEIGVNPLEE